MPLCCFKLQRTPWPHGKPDLKSGTPDAVNGGMMVLGLVGVRDEPASTRIAAAIHVMVLGVRQFRSLEPSGREWKWSRFWSWRPARVLAGA